MQAVKSPFVLLLEKDWKLVESRATVFRQLDLAKRLMFSRQNGSRADLVKFRSRWNFGFPNVSPRKTVPPDWDIGVSMVAFLLLSTHSQQPDESPVNLSHRTRCGLGRAGSRTCSATSTTTKATRCS